MNLVPPPDEYRDVRDVAMHVLSDTSPPDVVHDIVDRAAGTNPAVDAAFAELGFLGMDVAADEGGGGADLAHLRHVAEACGDAAASTQLLGTTGLCIGALLQTGSSEPRERWLPRLAAGEVTGTAALPGVFTRVSAPEQVTARRSGDGWLLSGRVTQVVDAPGADLLVVLAAAEDDERFLGLVELPTSGITTEHQPTVDRTRRLGSVQLDEVHLPASGVIATGDLAEQAVEALTDRMAVLVAADAVGTASRVVGLTTDYAKQREQFGRPIGSFQAVKHQAADMLVQTELSRVLVDDAAAAVAERRPDASLAASMAKEFACSAAAWVAGRGVQLHGGIGYTWEHAMHIHLKRAKLDEALFGDRRWHRERIARLLTTPDGDNRP